MNNSSQCIAFIDPLSSPIYLAAKLHSYNFKLVAVYTLSKMSEDEKRIRFHPDLFDHVIYADDDSDVSVEYVAKQLKNFGVQYVFYGYEATVVFADKVSRLVCPDYANDLNTSQRRFNKYEMQEALQAVGIPHVKQVKVLNKKLGPQQITELKQWQFPVMVKPLDGAGSIGVKKCHSIESIADFIQDDGHIFMHSVLATDYTVQELLIGEEYYVDTFSLNGKHQVASVNHYCKDFHTDVPIYRTMVVVDPQMKEWQICVDYVLKVLDAVGLQNGFAHTELFLTADGPRLIEVNPRISGASGYGNKLAEQILQYSQPEALFDTLSGKPAHQADSMKKYGIQICVQNWQPRNISALNENLLTSLPSHVEHMMLKQPGAYLNMPQTLLDTVVFVLLANHDEKQLLHDYKQLTEWEEQGKLF